MSSSRQPCKFYNSPSGCNRGKSCTFSHTRDTERRGGGRRLSSASVASDGSSSSRRPQTPTSSSTPPPRGVCRFFWDSGRCSREFECRYEHTQGPGQGLVRQDSIQSPRPLRAPMHSPQSLRSPIHSPQLLRSPMHSPQPPRAPTQAAQEFIAPFLTEEGLAKLVGGGTDGYFPLDTTSMTPTDAHGHLRRFLRDDFRFRITHEIYGFLTPLSSANNQNSSWVGPTNLMKLPLVNH